jgi:hypothetical protein
MRYNSRLGSVAFCERRQARLHRFRPVGAAVPRLQLLDLLAHERQIVHRGLELLVRRIVESHEVDLIAALENVDEPCRHELGGIERRAVLAFGAHAVAGVDEQ